MAALFKGYLAVSRLNEYVFLLLACLQPQWGLLWSLSFLTLGATKLQAATSSPSLMPQLTPAAELESSQSQFTPQVPPVAEEAGINLLPENSDRVEVTPIRRHYQLQPQPFLIAGPNNFNPNLRTAPAASPQPPAATTTPAAPPQQPSSPLPPSPLPPPASTPPTAATEQQKPAVVLENIQTDFRNDRDNFGQENRFIEPTAQFRLRNGDIIRFKTGFNSFYKPDFNFVSNIPLQVGYETKIGKITLQGDAGVDLFNRLPAAINLNAKVDTPIAPNVTLSGVVEQGAYKSSAETLENQITSWRYGPNLYWQIDPKTYLFSLLRLGNYNDGNFEQQSFTRLERKFGEFFVAANLFNWSYTNDVQETSGYFSPPDFIVYTGEVGWEGPIFDFLRCRVTASLGQQRLNGNFDNANNYEGRCTTKISPTVDADFGYTFSNVQNRQTGGSAYNNQSFTGVLRVKF